MLYKVSELNHFLLPFWGKYCVFFCYDSLPNWQEHIFQGTTVALFPFCMEKIDKFGSC